MWPPEIDIMELLGSDPTTYYMSQHWGAPTSPGLAAWQYTGPDFSAGFHTFAVEWQPGVIRWLLDGQVLVTSTYNVPDVPMYLILNTAVGGNWPGNPTDQTVFPQYHDVDYVRVYRDASPGPAGAQVAGTPQPAENKAVPAVRPPTRRLPPNRTS
jgi:beta-glucanase (GH16 family)